MDTPIKYNDLKSFSFWCQKVLPLVYDESLSYYEVLCKLTDYVNKLIENYNELYNLIAPFDITVEEMKHDIAVLQDELEKVKNGDYVSLYIDALGSWIDKNLQDMVHKIVKYVAFGLSDDGHFIAHIPSTWDFIEFDTCVVPHSPIYGHLILRW